MKILTGDCFELIRIINKLGIKKDLIKLLKDITKVSMKSQKLQDMLLNIANSEFDGDIKKAVEVNIELAEEYDNSVNDQNSLGMEGIFLVLEAMPNAEVEVKKMIAKLNDVTVKEVEKYEAFELAEKIKEIVMCESFKRFFTQVMK